MKTFFCLAQLLCVLSCLPGSPPERPAVGAAVSERAGQEGAEQLIERAEQKFAEGSFQLALGLYEEAARLDLDAEQRRWVEFRSADARWRSAAATDNPDTSELDRAVATLRELLERTERPEQRDDVWALIEESLGDFHWERRQSQDWGSAWPHYQEALQYWARSSDLERARERYLAIVWKAALPEWTKEYWGWGWWAANLPVEVLENAVKVAQSDADRAHAHYLLGRHWMNQGWDRRAAERVRRELGAVIELGRALEWYDDALYFLAQFDENTGSYERQPDGSWQMKPDYVAAVELYRRLLGEFQKGETRYYDDAKSRVQLIVEPTLSVGVDRFFLPGSEVGFTLGWRNLARVDLALHPVDLTRDLAFGQRGAGDWLASIDLAGNEPVQRWTHDTKDAGKHEPGSALLALEKKPDPGAYVLVASGDGRKERALVLVGDAAVTVKVSGTKLLAWATDVERGAPLAEATLKLHERWYDGDQWRWKEKEQKAGVDGVATFELEKSRSNGEFFVVLKSGARQAFAQVWNQQRPAPAQEWRIQAFTDRSAYRPEDAVHWRFLARTRFATEYRTPADQTVHWRIRDPHGAVVAEGNSQLNAFGAAWSTLETTAAMPLGEYVAEFALPDGSTIGGATLFRLEEYKLPEFEVAVKVPEEPAGSGKPKLYRLGDRVEVDVTATYYYGAPVADASVEVFVHQRPFLRPIPLAREFPWYYEGAATTWWGGPGQQVLHQVFRTDAAGVARIAFDSAADLSGEVEYTIEARVTDASRREIVGDGRVLVAEKGYRVDVQVAHAIHRPGTKVEVEFHAQDPNDNPVEDDGKVEVTRERWIEIWLDPSGREVLGDELRLLQQDPRGFPPTGDAALPSWRPKFRGYEKEVVATANLRTGKDGKASFEFTPAKEGTYRVTWRSTDDRDADVEAQTTVFVADEDTVELGYLPGGIEILVDKDTLEVGEEAAILLLAPSSGRWVLFTVEGEELHQHEVVQLTGQVKLVKLPITELHVPNVFLGATMIERGRAWQDVEELVVPPKEQFLDVALAWDREAYLPGDEGVLAITVLDHAGKPVVTELALSVVDDALAYIQGDYAMDPRQFFYGEKRGLWVQTGGTFQHGWYARFDKDEKGALRERTLAAGAKDEREQLEQLGYGGDRLAAVEMDVAGAVRQEYAAKSVSRRDFPAAAPAEARENARGGLAGPGGQEPAVRVRSDFRETALWIPDLRTDEAGKGTAKVRFPDSTTRWRASARGSDTSTRVGIGNASTRTRQPLIARLQAPRFFQVGDAVTVSGNLNNNTGSPLIVRPSLELSGLAFADEARPDSVTVPANGQVRVDWRVRASAPGTARLKLSAIGAGASDAMERELPVHPHGIEAFVARAGKLASGELAFTLDLPQARASDSTRVEVQVAPSLAVTMLDALPYLADYPYGCTEQTLSRFLPAAIVAKTLRDFGLSAEDALTRVFGGIEREFADKTHPGGKKPLAKLDEMVKDGLERLYDFQHEDGGWAWWKEGDSDHFMSAYVLWGLSLARDGGIDVREGVLERAAHWLAREIVERENQADLQCWMLHALATYGRTSGDEARFVERAFANLWTGREQLNAYSRALLALSAHALGKQDEARILAENLLNGAIVDATPDVSIVQVGAQRSEPYVLRTAHWGQDGIWRRWSEGSVEATAFALRALVAIDPEHELVEPVMNWLVKNRRGAQWSNTRDTAITVLALNDYLRASKELGSAVEFELAVNGTKVAGERLEKDELLRAPSVFAVDRALLKDGANEIRLTRKAGDGPLYFAARARFFSLEEPIPSRGSEVFVRREYWKLVGRPTLLEGTVFDRVPLADQGSITSGERVEVVLTLEAKNDLEYLVLEDMKPAGLEAVQVRSGEPIAARELQRSETERRFGAAGDASAGQDARAGGARGSRLVPEDGPGHTGRSRSAHQELRDRHVAFFLDKLPQGVWEIRYELRAETPGSFHALPLLAHAMYVPEIRANAEELRVTVADR